MFWKSRAVARTSASCPACQTGSASALPRSHSHRRARVAVSDHAASYFAYLVMQRLGVPVVSLPMSLVTLHNAPLAVAGQLAVAVSQSGQSPDLVDDDGCAPRGGRP